MELLRLARSATNARTSARAASSTTWHPSPPTSTAPFLASDGIARVRAALSGGELSTADVDGLRIGSPVTRPTAVVCIGQNYAAHAAESGSLPPEHSGDLLQASEHRRRPGRRRAAAAGRREGRLGGRAGDRDRQDGPVPVVAGCCARSHRRVHDLERRVGAGVPARRVGWAVVEGQVLRDVQTRSGPRSCPPTRSTRRRCGCARS